MSEKLLQTVDLRRVFSETGENLEILKGVNFEMEAGELVALTGSVLRDGREP